MPSTYRFNVRLTRKFAFDGAVVDRADFYAWLWAELGERGLAGIHEGTLLLEQAADEGLASAAWTVDSGEAPRERDWIGDREVEDAELYFDSEAQARAARERLIAGGLAVAEVTEQPAQDWDAEWKASFLAEPEGVAIAPFWRVVPPWGAAVARADDISIKINPGAGFGTGTHETTQLCLRVIGEWLGRGSRPSPPVRALDFGSGSGILAIGAALLGSQVDAVEIDALAVDNARENACLNGVAEAIDFRPELAPWAAGSGDYPLVIANILRPVLLEFAPELVRRLRPAGSLLVLSGLIENDVPSVRDRYAELLGGEPAQVLAQGEWRALVFRR